MTATLISTSGYALAIYGAWILYQNATPDYGHGTIPALTDEEAKTFFQDQERAIEDRQNANQRGFGFVLVGSVLQLIGTLIAGFVGG